MIMGRPSYFIILYCSLSISYVLTIVSQISLVEGLYIVRAQIHGYRNPYQYRLLGCSSTRCQAICCDSNIMRQCISGERQCDTFFIFCLRPLGTSGYGCSSLNNDSVTVSDVNLNDAAIDFSNSTFLGLSNPLVLQGSTNVWNGTRLEIEVRDWDEDGSQLIDIIRVDIPVSSLKTQTSIFRLQGLVRITEIIMNLTVSCAQNFQGSDCTECISGFIGTLCNEIDNCGSVTCSGHGKCVDGVNSFICNCDPGFTGVECQDSINDCIEQGVNCSGNGKCMDGMNTFSCSCDPGFTGELCQTNIDDCVGVNCSGNGVCVDDVNSFTCQCSPGFSETMCTKVVEFKGSKVLVPAVGGAIGGVLVIIIFLALVILLIIAKCRTRPELKPNSEDIEMKENEIYGVSMATVQAGQPQMQYNALMSGYVCYATTQHMEIVDNECYGSVPEK